MVDAFQKISFNAPITHGKPPAKIGHQDGQEDPQVAERLFGSPALGYVSRLYVEGDKLLADFKDVPRRFGMLIKAGAYRRVSAEIFWNYVHADGVTYPRVLKAVSFLGADIPALTNLKEIEALYKKTDTGSLYAYDEQEREYRVYYCDSPSSGMSMADFLVMYPRKEKADVKFGDGDEDERCGSCKYWVPGFNACTLVEGRIEFQDWCNLFEPYFTGEYQRKDFVIEKRGDEWCLLTHDKKKVLGCHDTKEGAIKQEQAIKANARKEPVMKAVKLSRSQVRIICPSCADSMESKGISALSFETQEEAERFLYMTAAECMGDEKMVEKYPDKALRKEKCAAMAKENIDSIEREIKRHSEEGDSMKTEAEIQAEKEKLQKERTELEQQKKDFEAKRNGDEEARLKADKEKAEADAKEWRERVEKLETEREAREIDSMILKWKQDKKVVAAEEPRLRALFKALRGQPKIVRFADGDKQIEESPEDTLRAIIDGRKPHQLFTEFSRLGGDDENDPANYANPGDEVHAKTLKYQAANVGKSYQQARDAVLAADPTLKERYAAARQ